MASEFYIRQQIERRREAGRKRVQNRWRRVRLLQATAVNSALAEDSEWDARSKIRKAFRNGS